MKRLTCICHSALLSSGLTACSQPTGSPAPTSAAPVKPAHTLGLSALSPGDFSSDSGANCESTSGNGMSFTLSPNCSPRIKSHASYSQGTFSADLQPPSYASGACSSFYMSSGEGSSSHSEVDFEFLGNHQNGVQLNLFVDGKSRGGVWKDLPFNPGDGTHNYSISLTGDRVSWSVDGTEIYSQSSADQPMPNKPMMIYSSFWNAGDLYSSWAGPMDWSKAPYSYEVGNVQANGN